MLKKPSEWDNVEAIEPGEFVLLELGGHEVVIKNAYEYVGQTGTKSLRVEVDIAGTDKQAGYFQKQYDNNLSTDRKWSNNACKYISLKEDANCIGMFKGFTTAVENSNPGYKWDFDENTLKGKKLCGVFGLEEFERQDGKIGTVVRLMQFRSLDKLNQVDIPNVKLIDGTFMSYDDYEEIMTERTNLTVSKGNAKADKIDKFIEDNMLD